MACGASDAAAQGLLNAHQTTKSKADGPLKAAVASYAAKLQAAKQVVADLKRSGDDELASARLQEEVETVALKQDEATEANLVQLLDNARSLCALPLEDVLCNYMQVM